MLNYSDTVNLTEIGSLLDKAYTHYAGRGDGACKSLEGRVTVSFGTTFDRLEGDFIVKEVMIYSSLFGGGEEDPDNDGRRHYFKSTHTALAAVRVWHQKEMATRYDKHGFVIDKD